MRISLQEASEQLKSGKVVAVPTETVYGLAASLSCPEAIQTIFQLKGRPSDNPLIIHVSSVSEVVKYCKDLPPYFDKLAVAFWPGPMTLVLSIDENTIPPIPRAGLPTAAFRIPSHPIASQLLQMTGPLVMPSANISGRPSATTWEHVEFDFGPHFPILDGGRCGCGVESTILMYDQDQWQIIRLGGLPADAFASLLGYLPTFNADGQNAKPICPGQKYRHYAPKAKLHFSSHFHPDFNGVILGFHERNYPKGSHVKHLGSCLRPESAAENLYVVLRELDTCNISEAWIDSDFPDSGLWKTIAERLYKASR